MQVYPYDLYKVCLLNLTLFLHIPQHKYSVPLLTKFVGLFTSSLSGFETNGCPVARGM